MAATLRGLVSAAGIDGTVGPVGVTMQEPRLWPIEVDGRHGAIDLAGKVVIEPQYDESLEFAGGMARVSLNGKIGFVDTHGVLLISPKKTITRGSGDFAAEISIASCMGPAFAEGLALYELDGRIGYVDTRGEIVIPGAFDKASLFREGLAMVRQGGKYGWIDRSGALVIPAVYDNAEPFSDGLACVLRYDHHGWGYLDRRGEWKIRPGYNYAYPFVEQRARAQVKGGYAYLDPEGRIAVPPPSGFKISTDFSDGRALFHQSGSGWGYLDPDGAIAIAPRFFGGFRFREGLARATLTGGLSAEGKRTQKRFGFIDRDGVFVIDAQYDEAGDFSEGLAGIGLKNKGYGYVDATGALRVPTQYAGVESFHGGLARVWIEQPARGPHAYLDRDGREVWRSPA